MGRVWTQSPPGQAAANAIGYRPARHKGCEQWPRSSARRARYEDIRYIAWLGVTLTATASDRETRVRFSVLIESYAT